MIRVAFLGDICLQHKDLIDRSWEDPAGLHDTVGEFVQGIDFSIATLECPLLGDERTRNREKLALHASPKTIQFLKSLKVKVVTLANNHIADYGDECGLATIELLEEAGIKWFGAGYAGREGNPVILKQNDIALACIGYSRPPCDAVFSSPESFGSARYARASLEYLISDLKEVDYVLVFMHWGMGDVNYPVPENVKTAHEIIDLGADAIIGSHPHVYQAYEIYKDKYILYSLGNCIFGDIVAAPARENTTFTKIQAWRNRIGLAPVFSIDKSGLNLVELKFVHFRNDNTIAMLTGLKAGLNSFYLARISAKLKSKLTSRGNYERWWRRTIRGAVFLSLLERSAAKGTIFRPGVRHLRTLKRMFRQDVQHLQTGYWQE